MFNKHKLLYSNPNAEKGEVILKIRAELNCNEKNRINLLSASFSFFEIEQYEAIINIALASMPELYLPLEDTKELLENLVEYSNTFSIEQNSIILDKGFDFYINEHAKPYINGYLNNTEIKQLRSLYSFNSSINKSNELRIFQIAFIRNRLHFTTVDKELFVRNSILNNHKYIDNTKGIDEEYYFLIRSKIKNERLATEPTLEEKLSEWENVASNLSKKEDVRAFDNIIEYYKNFISDTTLQKSIFYDKQAEKHDVTTKTITRDLNREDKFIKQYNLPKLQMS